MSQVRSSNSDFSNIRMSFTSLTTIDEAISVNENEKKGARSNLYSLLFQEKLTKLVILPSILIGAAPLSMYYVFGAIISEISLWMHAGRTYDPFQECLKSVYVLLIISVFAGIFKFIDTFCWIRIGSNLSTKVRRQVFSNLMKSEVSFFDTTPIGGILTLLSEDVQQVEDAFGQIKGNQLQGISQFFTGILIAFIFSWKMALVSLVVIPAIVIIALIFTPGITKFGEKKFKYVSDSMTIAEETLSFIRTVRGFNREGKEIERFENRVNKSVQFEQKLGYRVSGMTCLVMLSIWGMVLGNFYFGSTLVEKGEMLAGDMFSVFGYTMLGCLGALSVQGTMQTEQKAIAAGARVLKLSHHVPSIPFEGGIILDDFKGEIEFRNVSFKYPTRDVYVLKDVSFIIKPGQTGALVGHSGSGKSTCIQLIERYYDVSEGYVLFDGVDVRELDPRWLHRNISLVSQEPTLFQMSIKENIAYGCNNLNENDVFEAAEIASCKKFIEKLSDGYNTLVGERGSSLSGGQRQRIAIARAIIKKPKILITDEATSALDSGSEKKVQVALDRVMKNLTAIIVAHRLCTIRNSHVIYVFDAGEIKEVGNHESLVEAKGYYYNLIQRQLMQEELHNDK